MATPRLGLVVEDKPTELSCRPVIHTGSHTDGAMVIALHKDMAQS